MRPAVRSRRHLVAVAVAATLTTVAVTVASPAAADPTGDARARAASLRQQVQSLQVEAEVAIEHFDTVQTRLAAAVTAQQLAARAADGESSVAQAAADREAARVRALYMAGGQSALLATVLGGTDPADALDRWHVVTRLMSADAEVSDRTAVAARGADDHARRLAQLASQVTRLQTAAADATHQVQGLLARQRDALAAADAQVRTLVLAAQRQAATADAAAFAAALQAAGGSLTGTTAAPNSLVATALAAARTRLGAPYVWGATGPDTFDCSGLTQWAYARAGIALPRVAADQWNTGPHPDLAQLLPGDLLFWATDTTNPATIHHVAIYLGGGQMVAAPHTGDVVKVQPVYMNGFIGATRPWAAAAA